MNPPDDLLILNIRFSPARTQSLLGISERYVLIGKVLCLDLAGSLSVRKNQEGKKAQHHQRTETKIPLHILSPHALLEGKVSMFNDGNGFAG